jgi:hypothetical protein
VAQVRWYLNNTTIDGWQLLDQSAATAATLPNGWVVGTGATFSSELASGAAGDRASTTFTANTVPDGTLDTTLKDACRSQFAWTGNFAAGNWTFQFAVVSTVQSGAADGQIVFRVLKANADGSGATEITTGQQATTVATNVAGTDVNITATWAAPAWSITNQYIFVQLAWKRTGAGGMTTTNIRLRTGSSTTVGTTGLTANFTESLLTASVFETVAVSEFRKAVLPQLTAVEVETVSVTELRKPVLRQLAVHAADSVGVSDSASVTTAGGGGGPAVITLVTSGHAHGNSGAFVTGLDMTGVDLIVLVAARYDSGPAYAISDSESNTYVPGTAQNNSSAFTQVRAFYAWNPTVSASMDFSHPGAVNYATLVVLGFAGVDRLADPLVTQSGLGSYSAANGPVAVGSIASLAAGDLLVSGVGQYPDRPTNWTTVTLPTSVLAEIDVGTAGATFGASAAYHVNATGSAESSLTPTWTPDPVGASDVYIAGVVLTFRAAVGAPPGGLTVTVAETIGVTESASAVPADSAPPALEDIVFDSASTGGTNGGTGSLTFAFNNVAGDLVVVGIRRANAYDLTTVTYGGVAMTLAAAETFASSLVKTYLYYLAAPPTGTNNVVVNASTNQLMHGVAVSYRKVDQSDPLDALGLDRLTGTSLTLGTTTSLDKCWAVAVATNLSGITPSAGAGTTQRAVDSSGQVSLYDGNAAVSPPGATSLEVQFSASGAVAGVLATFIPAVASVLLLDTGSRLLLDAGGRLLLAGVAAPPGPPLTITVADTVTVSDPVSVDFVAASTGGLSIEYDFTTESDVIPLPDPPWQAVVGQLKNASGQATPVAFGGIQAVRWNPSTNTFDQDQFMELLVGAGSATAGYQQFLFVRGSGTDATSFHGYVLYWGDGYGGAITIGRIESGGFAVLQVCTGSAEVGKWLRLEVEGTVLRAYKEGALIGSAATTGTSYTGQPGFGGYYVGYDNTDTVRLGELGAPAAVPSVETIGVTDSVNAVLRQLAVHAADAVAVTELRRAVLPQLAIHAADALTVAESRTAVLPQLAVHAAETIGVAELRKPVLSQLAVHAAEALTVTDVVTPQLRTVRLKVAVADALLVTESAKAALAQLVVRAADSVAVAEFRRAVLPQLAVHVAEVLTVTEFPKAVLPQLAVHAADTITVAEAASARSAVLAVARADSVSVADSVKAVLPQLAVHAAETIGVTESTKLVFPQLVVRVADSVAVAEFRKAVLPQLAVHAAEALSITDFRKAALGQLVVRAAEIVTVAEFPKAVLPQLAVHAAETISVTEARATRLQPLVVRAVETITVTDFLTAGAAAINASVFETITVTEARATRLQPLVVRPAEAVAVLDAASAVLRTARLKVASSDAIGVTDSLKAVLTPLAVHAAEALTVTEFRRALLPQLAVHAVEVLTVAEFRKAALGQLAVRVSDSIGVTDPVSAEVRLAVGGQSRSEAVGVTDAASAALRTIRLSVAVSESVAVLDSILLGQKLTLTRFEAVTVTDSVKAVLPLVVRVADSIGTTDSVRRGLQLGVVRAEAIGVADSPKVALRPLVARPAELVTVTDSVIVQLRTARLTVASGDAVGVTDVPRLVLQPLVVRVADSVTVADVARAGAAAINLDGGQTVTVTDSVKAVLPQLVVRAADALLVTDTVKAALPRLVVHVADSVSLTDAVRAVLPQLGVHAFETVTVVDAPPKPVLPELRVAVAEDVAVTDRVMAAFGVLAVDEVTVTEALALSFTPVTHFVVAELRDVGSRSHQYGILVGEEFDGELVGMAGGGRLAGPDCAGTLVGGVGGRLVRVET